MLFGVGGWLMTALCFHVFVVCYKLHFIGFCMLKVNKVWILMQFLGLFGPWVFQGRVPFMCGGTINQGRQVERGKRISWGFPNSFLLSCLGVRLAPMRAGWMLPVVGSTRRRLPLMAHSSLGVWIFLLSCVFYSLFIHAFVQVLYFVVLGLFASPDFYSVLVLFRHSKGYWINKFLMNYLYFRGTQSSCLFVCYY